MNSRRGAGAGAPPGERKARAAASSGGPAPRLGAAGAVAPLPGTARPSFVAGALVLVAGSLLSRTLGATYRLILPILMGGGQRAAVGMGLFQIAYPIFTVFATLITTGFPLAVSKLVSARLARSDAAGARRVLQAARLWLPLFGLGAAALLWAMAPDVAHYIAGDPRAVLTMRAIAPALFTVSLASAYRGAFQGMEDMWPYAVSQIIEQIARVLTMFALVVALLPRGIAWAAAGASFGAVTGGLGATVTMLVLWARRGRHRLRAALDSTPRHPAPPAATAPSRPLLAEILGLALPIAAAATLLPLLNLSDAAIVPLRLRAAGLGHEAIALYGALTGYAAPLVLAPTVFTSALAMSLLPAVSSALSAGDREAGRHRAAAGLRLTVLLALPASAGLMVLSHPIPRLLFHSRVAATPLLAMAPALLFLSLQQTSSGVLQGLGRADLPMRHLAIGGAVKVALTWWLVARPAWNIAGAALGTTAAFVCASTLNLRAVEQRCRGAVDLKGMALAPLASTLIMAAAVAAVAEAAAARPLVATCGGVAVGAIVYLGALLAFGALRRADLELIPGVGARAATVLQRAHLLRSER